MLYTFVYYSSGGVYDKKKTKNIASLSHVFWHQHVLGSVKTFKWQETDRKKSDQNIENSLRNT